jgi:hypothetical protein
MSQYSMSCRVAQPTLLPKHSTTRVQAQVKGMVWVFKSQCTVSVQCMCATQNHAVGSPRAKDAFHIDPEVL